MTPDVYEKMQCMIVPIGMEVTQIDGTWKLGQNKPDQVRMGAADGLKSSDIGSEIETLAEHMQGASER